MSRYRGVAGGSARTGCERSVGCCRRCAWSGLVAAKVARGGRRIAELGARLQRYDAELGRLNLDKLDQLDPVEAIPAG